MEEKTRSLNCSVKTGRYEPLLFLIKDRNQSKTNACSTRSTFAWFLKSENFHFFFVMSFEKSLKGGHPNSLGNTLEVVDAVLGNTDKMEDLFLCYQSDDETVRLRTSNAFKRIFRAKPELFNKWKQRFIKEVAEIDQPSANWTSIQILNELFDQLMKRKKLNLLKSA